MNDEKNIISSWQRLRKGTLRFNNNDVRPLIIMFGKGSKNYCEVEAFSI